MNKKLKIYFYGVMPDMKDYLRKKLKGHSLKIDEKPIIV